MSGLRVARSKRPGIIVFYVPSRSEPGVEHTVHYVRSGRRRFWHCSCKDYLYNKMPLGQLCDHAKALKLLAKEYHGISKLAKVARRRSGYVIPADSAIHHINGNIYDNRPENLRVVNIRENRVSA